MHRQSLILNWVWLIWEEMWNLEFAFFCLNLQAADTTSTTVNRIHSYYINISLTEALAVVVRFGHNFLLQNSSPAWGSCFKGPGVMKLSPLITVIVCFSSVDYSHGSLDKVVPCCCHRCRAKTCQLQIFNTALHNLVMLRCPQQSQRRSSAGPWSQHGGFCNLLRAPPHCGLPQRPRALLWYWWLPAPVAFQNVTFHPTASNNKSIQWDCSNFHLFQHFK